MIFNVRKSNLPFFSMLIISTYLVSRFLFLAKGVEYDASGLGWHWQYLDVTILRNNLLAGVLYQHSQPPLFNLLLGVVLKFFPDNYEYVFVALYCLCGLVLYFSIYKILHIAEFGSWAAFGVATIFIVSPEAVLYENWLSYTWPIATILTFAAYALLLYEKTSRLKYAVVFLITICLVCLTRSAFHLVYLAVCILLVLVVRSPNRRLIGIASLCALLLVSSIYIKNFVLFGFFGSSSWMGMNLWRIGGRGEVSTLEADPSVTSVEPFSPIPEYPEKYHKVPVFYSEISGLTAEHKENGHINLNHYGYIGISNEYLKASLHSISHDFLGYLKNVIRAWGIYSKPSWDYWFLNNNRHTIQDYIDVVSFAKCRFLFERKVFRISQYYDFPISSLLIIPAALGLVVIFSILDFIKYSRGSICVQRHLFFSFMVWTILYIAVIGNSIEYGENNRFRVETDPLLYVATVISIREIWRIFRSKIRKRVFR